MYEHIANNIYLFIGNCVCARVFAVLNKKKTPPMGNTNNNKKYDNDDDGQCWGRERTKNGAH